MFELSVKYCQFPPGTLQVEEETPRPSMERQEKERQVFTGKQWDHLTHSIKLMSLQMAQHRVLTFRSYRLSSVFSIKRILDSST